MIIKILLFCIYCMVVPLNIFALECPKYPEQYKKDWDTEINLAIGKIGPAKGAELQTKVKNVTKDLIAKFPNAEKIYLEQMMYAAYCSALRDDKVMTESEKAERVREYNEKVRKAFSTLPLESKNDTNIDKKNLSLNIKKSIRGSVLLKGLNGAGLNDFVLSSKIKYFYLGLDDIILKYYYIIIFHLINSGTHIGEPITFSVYTGSSYSKILDVKHKINKPKNKTVNVKSSIPVAKWVWPESGISIKFNYGYPINNEELAGVNIYRSMLRDSGYGRINPTLVGFPEWEAIEKATSELFSAYYKVAYVNTYGREYNLSEPLEVGNRAPFKSFKNKNDRSGNIYSYNDYSMEYPLDELGLRFAEGYVDITFPNGLDASADLHLYILCKMLPGSILAPLVTLNGSPSVHFELKDKIKSIEIPAVHFVPDKLREKLTPLEVRFYATSNSIYIKWEKPKAKEFTGVRIFRTQERQIGDLKELTQDQEIYDGPGLKEKTVLVLPLIEKANVIGTTARSTGSLRYNLPPDRKKLVPRVDNVSSGKGIPIPGPPTMFSIHDDISFSSDYYLDTSPDQQKNMTYVIYGYDGNGNASYPVLINASTARLGSEVTVFK